MFSFLWDQKTHLYDKKLKKRSSVRNLFALLIERSLKVIKKILLVMAEKREDCSFLIFIWTYCNTSLRDKKQKSAKKYFFEQFDFYYKYFC